VTVTAIVPVRNGGRYLGGALDSIRAQTRRADEVIVVDDGSTDGSAELAESYADVRCIRQASQGCAAARNAGIAAARGDLLAFLDADDEWTEDKLAVQVAYLEEHRAVPYVLARQTIHLEPGVTRPAGLRPEHLEHDQVGYLPSTLVARREVFAQIGGFDAGYAVASDVEWFVRAKDAGLLPVVVPRVLVRRRLHTTNVSSAVAPNHAALLRIFKASIDRQRGTQ
jgi:glycosyltransferase involved in cell wall biosynthesis